MNSALPTHGRIAELKHIARHAGVVLVGQLAVMAFGVTDTVVAARYSDRLVVLHQGRVLADGEPWQVITPEVLDAAFGLEALVIADPASGRPLVVPLDPSGAHPAERAPRVQRVPGDAQVA